ncbi:MAG: alpha/beta hydrolase [Clostridia bacterium]|nr:alpha/beta hydrolase [Clostridia bacterium]
MKVLVNGLNIEYSDCGEGDAVVILHGWSKEREPYAPLSALISEGYRAIAPSLPGFGESDEPLEPWPVDKFADTVCEFIVALGLKKVILMGHSYGGRVIIKLASREALPFEISKIILVDAAGVLPKRGLNYKIKVTTYKIGKRIMLSAPMKKLFPKAVERWQAKQGSADYAAASPVMRGCLVKAVNEDLTPLFEKIKQEVLLVWGTLDDATPLSDGILMERLMPNAGLARIEGAGHFSWLDNPGIFNAIIRSYLNIN